MSHRHRFIGEKIADDTWQLSGDEAHHLAKVVRLETGTAVEVTDGKGWWALGTVTSSNAREALITTEPAQFAALPTVPLLFAIGALRPGAIDELLPTLTELGIDAFHVFQQEETAKTRLAPKVIERWQRILVAAVKQCKRARIPELHQHDSVWEMIDWLQEHFPGIQPLRLLLSADAEVTLAQCLDEPAALKPTAIVAVAGGEKGLSTAEERALLKSDFSPVRLGEHVLRAVTAALAVGAVMALHRDGTQQKP